MAWGRSSKTYNKIVPIRPIQEINIRGWGFCSFPPLSLLISTTVAQHLVEFFLIALQQIPDMEPSPGRASMWWWLPCETFPKESGSSLQIARKAILDTDAYHMDSWMVWIPWLIFSMGWRGGPVDCHQCDVQAACSLPVGLPTWLNGGMAGSCRNMQCHNSRIPPSATIGANSYIYNDALDISRSFYILYQEGNISTSVQWFKHPPQISICPYVCFSLSALCFCLLSTSVPCCLR